MKELIDLGKVREAQSRDPPLAHTAPQIACRPHAVVGGRHVCSGTIHLYSSMLALSSMSPTLSTHSLLLFFLVLCTLPALCPQLSARSQLYAPCSKQRATYALQRVCCAERAYTAGRWESMLLEDTDARSVVRGSEWAYGTRRWRALVLGMQCTVMWGSRGASPRLISQHYAPAPFRYPRLAGAFFCVHTVCAC